MVRQTEYDGESRILRHNIPPEHGVVRPDESRSVGVSYTCGLHARTRVATHAGHTPEVGSVSGICCSTTMFDVLSDDGHSEYCVQRRKSDPRIVAFLRATYVSRTRAKHSERMRSTVGVGSVCSTSRFKKEKEVFLRRVDFDARCTVQRAWFSTDPGRLS